MVRMSRLPDEALEFEEAGRQGWLAALGPEHQDIAEARREALALGSAGTEGELSTLPKVGPTATPALIPRADSSPVQGRTARVDPTAPVRRDG
jgi:hypothetical protein